MFVYAGHVVASDAFEVLEDFGEDVMDGEAEFLIKHLGGCRAAEVVETIDFGTGTEDGSEGRGESGCQTEGWESRRDDALLVFVALVKVESERRHRYYACRNLAGGELFGDLAQQ